jgi:gamma-glutamylcyclotransferase (GGCT)/AIG2-like uncharacterized protein YtfP
MPWLFTYGSLMNPQRFREIAGKWIFARKAKLHGFHLVFSGKGSADIVCGETNSVVYGVAYEVTDRQLNALDNYEGVPVGFYTRKKILIEMKSRRHEAFVYVKTKKVENKNPPSRYMKQIVAGLRFHGYEESIVREIQNWT